MGTLIEKRFELARHDPDTVVTGRLGMVKEALDDGAVQAFTPAQLREFKAIRDRIRSGAVPTYSLQDVKRRAKKHLSA